VGIIAKEHGGPCVQVQVIPGDAVHEPVVCFVRVRKFKVARGALKGGSLGWLESNPALNAVEPNGTKGRWLESLRVGGRAMYQG